jgi:hypothetical protein
VVKENKTMIWVGVVQLAHPVDDPTTYNCVETPFSAVVFVACPVRLA